MAIALGWGASFGCGRSTTRGADSAGEQEPRPTPNGPSLPSGWEPTLPSSGGRFEPSLAAIAGNASFDVNAFSDVASCAECHPDVASQWSRSAHSRASLDNPYYRFVFESFQSDAGVRASRLCAGCHDPALLFDGAFDEEEPANIETDSATPASATSIAPEDRRAHVGIPCLLCHSAIEATADGDGSYRLDLSPVPLPDPADEASIEVHRRRLTPPPLRTEALCGSCHRSFLGAEAGLPHHLAGIDDLGDYRRSAYAGSLAERIDTGVEATSCRRCHMPSREAKLGDLAATEGRIYSHLWPGAHTTLAAATGDEGLLEEAQAVLREAVSIDVAAIRREGRALLPEELLVLVPGQTYEMDLVLRNRRVGHRFPGGTRDLQDSWLEATVVDARGRTIASAGDRHRRGEDPTALVFRSTLLDDAGHPERLHRVQHFRSLAFDRSIPARDAVVVRYVFELPRSFAPPLRIEARLQHRRHPRALERQACEATRSERGQRFMKAAEANGRRPVNGCVEQPVTEIASTRAWIGGLGSRGAYRVDSTVPVNGRRPTWERLYEHALGLSHARQEDLDPAHRSLDRATALLFESEPADDEERELRTPRLAMLRTLRARIDGRQGRWRDALAHLERAEAELGPHPAIDRARGHALARSWQWADASAAYARVWRATPRDDHAARDWAQALGSDSRSVTTLEATHAGLSLQPRGTALLRSQAIALARIAHRGRDAAQKAAEKHRLPDVAPALLERCRKAVEGCERDRQPIVTIEMRR